MVKKSELRKTATFFSRLSSFTEAEGKGKGFQWLEKICEQPIKNTHRYNFLQGPFSLVHYMLPVHTFEVKDDFTNYSKLLL